MGGYLYALVLVGIPGATGAFMIARGKSKRDINGGATVVIYAIAVGFVIYYLFPTGRLIGARYEVIIPVVLFAGFIIGGLVGLAWRRRDRGRF